MKKRKATAPPTNPLMVWANLAVTTSEMLLASSQVIGHRLNRIATAGVMPSKRDQREFVLMGQEKIEAATESAFAVAVRTVGMSQEMSVLAFETMMNAATGAMSFAASRSILQTTRSQEELVRQAIHSSAAAASQISESVANIAAHGLKPVHSRATKNAKRLRKG